MIIAQRYIGNRFVPGEILPDDLPKDMLDWLIRSGAAIHKAEEAAPEPAPEAEIPAPTGPAEAPAEDEPGDEELYEDEEAPEIDIMDGLIAPAEPAEPEKEPPRKRGRRAKGGNGE